MVENVERLNAKEEGFRLRKSQILGQREIEVVRAWAVEEPTLGSTGGSQRIHAEDRGVEIVVPVTARIVVQMQGSAIIVGFIDTAVVDPVGIRSDQRIVSIVDHGNRETARKSGDAGDGPALRQPVRTEVSIEGKLILIAQDEVVLYIER